MGKTLHYSTCTLFDSIVLYYSLKSTVNDYCESKILSPYYILEGGFILLYAQAIFSSVRKDKTTFQASMNIDRTLSSLIICQLNYDGDCLSYAPSHDVLLKSKKVTKEYNKEHSTNKQ